MKKKMLIEKGAATRKSLGTPEIRTNLFLKLRQFEFTLKPSLILEYSHFQPLLNSLLLCYYIINEV